MNRNAKAAQVARWRAAAKALDGLTGVMVRSGGREDAAVLIDIKTYVAVVRFASGPLSGRIREVPVDWVRPAAAFEIIN